MKVYILADFTLNLGAGHRLILAGAEKGLWWLVIGVAAVGLLVLLYRFERRLVSRRVGLGLLALRLAAALALVIALLDPIAEHSYRETVRGRVIVGVDLSESMATTDPGRPANEAAKLGKALGISPSQLANLSRREIARRLLQGDWLKRLTVEHEVELIGFARESVAGYTPSSMSARLAEPTKPDDLATQWTDWQAVLERALENPEGAPVLGVVLLTDGRQNTDSANDAANRLADRDVPVFPILIGSTIPPRDAAIALVKAPERVSKGDAADIAVTIKLDGMTPGVPVRVLLEYPGAEPLRQEVTTPYDGSRPLATFRVPLEEVGRQHFAVSVGPIKEDSRPDNDRRTFSIEVTDDKARVLLIDGEPRWEFRYLRNALRRDPHVDVEAVVFRQPPPLATAEPTYPSSLPPPAADGPDPLGAFDLIVVGDVSADDLPPASWQRLEWFADHRGGTLVLAAGPHLAESFASIETARKLLPVLELKSLPFDPDAIDPDHPSLPPGLAVRPSPGALADPGSWPMLRFAAEPDRNLAVWEGLAPLPWVLGGRPKPTATPLLIAVGDDISEGSSVVAAAMPYGLGKVLWVGTDSTWRWRYRVGDAYHHRFWGQVVRWAGSQPLTAGNRLVRFGPLRPKTAEGQTTPIRAQFAEDAPGITPDLLVAARVFRARGAAANSSPKPLPPEPEGEAILIVPLRPSTDQPRVFEGLASALPPGLYAVRLDVPQLPGAPTDSAPLEIAPRVSSERVELAATRDPLDRLALPTGGHVLSPPDAASLADLLSARNTPRIRVTTSPLWDRPWSLGLFFAILTAEWVLRKRVGLP